MTVHTTCPSCGTARTPRVTTHNVRDEHDRPHEIVFYNCRACGFSTWDLADYQWERKEVDGERSRPMARELPDA